MAIIQGIPGLVLRTAVSAAALLASSAAFAAPGDALGPVVRPSPETVRAQHNGQLARAASGAYATIWNEGDETQSVVGLYVRAYAADGTPRGPATLVDPSAAGLRSGGRIAMDAQGRFVVAWATTKAIMARHFADDGSPMGPAQQLAARIVTDNFVLRDHWDLQMAPDGRYVLMMERSVDPATQVNLIPVTITLQRFEADGRKRGLPLLAVTRLDYRADVALGFGPSIPPNVIRVQGNGGSSMALDAAGNIVLAWLSSTFTGYYPGDWGPGHAVGILRTSINLRRISAGGLPQGGVVKVAESGGSTTDRFSGFVYGPSVAREPDGDIAVAWVYPQSGVYLRRYDSSLNPQGISIEVSASALPDQTPALALAANGVAAVAWEQRHPSPPSPYENNRVWARLFDAAGAPLSAAVPAEPGAPGGQGDMTLGVDAQGNFVLGWHSLVRTGPSNYDNTEYLRRFSAQ